MKIKTTDYTRHIIGDNVALSFDDFYEDLTELRLNCPAHTKDLDYPRFDNDYLENSCESDKLKWEMDQRLVLEQEMKDRLYPRLLPQSPAGTVSEITSNDAVLNTLKPIIKEVYKKDVSSAESQCISSTYWDYENHIDAHNAYHDNVISAYWDESFERGDKELLLTQLVPTEMIKDCHTWVKDIKSCPPRAMDSASTIEEKWSERPLSKLGFSHEHFFYNFLPTSRRLKLQNHPNRPQWLPEDSFVCIVFLDFNTDPKFNEIPELEFWKHKQFAPLEEGRHKITEKELATPDKISQLFYYESWHYSEMTESNTEMRNMQLSDSVFDEEHTITEYDLIQSIPGTINGCTLFPGEYFHKLKFPRAYMELPMRTQVMVLK